jgi:hypothetical protein
VRNDATWFQLGIIGDAGPEITNGLGAFLYVACSNPGFDRASFFYQAAAPKSKAALIGQLGHQLQ